jgi:hypothetical protein
MMARRKCERRRHCKQRLAAGKHGGSRSVRHRVRAAIALHFTSAGEPSGEPSGELGAESTPTVLQSQHVTVRRASRAINPRRGAPRRCVGDPSASAWPKRTASCGCADPSGT